MNCHEFYEQVGGWLPYGASPRDESEHQVKMWERLVLESPNGEPPRYPLTFLRASVGSGKTEAVLFPCLSTLQGGGDSKRLFLVYPTRSLVDDQVQRILGEDGYLQQFSKATGCPVSANTDTGTLSQFWRVEGDKRTCYQRRTKRTLTKEGESCESLDFPYNPLYNADVILTTFDKFVFRFFGYGKRRWSYIFPFRVKPDLRPVVICFDEAHLYDSVAFTNFRELVNALVAHGVQVVVMSATLPSSLIEQTFPYAQPFEEFVVEGFVKGGNRKIEWQKEALDKQQFASKVRQLLTNAKATERRRIIVTNTVEQAYLVYSELQGMENLYFYHGRQLTDSRASTYAQLRQRDDKGEPYTLVTTNAIEVGCDLSADLLVTEVCNPDQLIQRIGRCARRSGQGRVIVLGNRVPAWMRDDMVDETAYLGSELPKFTDYDKSTVESLMSVVQGKPLMDTRIEMLFGALYDFVYEGDLSHLPLYKSGFVITRSWIPSATLYFVDAKDLDKVPWREWSKAPSLSVDLEYLSIYRTPEKYSTEVQRAQEDEDKAFATSEKGKPADERKVLAVPFLTDAQDPRTGRKLGSADFCIYVSHEKDRDYEDNWVKWAECQESQMSAYNYELAILLRSSEFPNLVNEGLVKRLKLFERNYQPQRQRVSIKSKLGNRERQLWYLQGE